MDTVGIATRGYLFSLVLLSDSSWQLVLRRSMLPDYFMEMESRSSNVQNIYLN